MNTRIVGFFISCLVTLTVILSAVVVAPLAMPIEMKTSHGTSYMSGGVGEDELETLRSLGQHSTLQLIFAQKEGNYLSDVAVSIRDRAGRPVLDAVSEGPLLFANLSPGQYTVTATMNGVSRQQQAQIVAHRQKQLAFYW